MECSRYFQKLQAIFCFWTDKPILNGPELETLANKNKGLGLVMGVILVKLG
jgi:hypothetical protein